MPVDEARIARNRETMEAHGLDGLICRLPENVLVLTGYWPLSSHAVAVVPREGDRWLVAVETEIDAIPDGALSEIRTFTFADLLTGPHGVIERHLADAVRALEIERGRIGVERSFEAIAPGHGAGEVLVGASPSHDTFARAAPQATLVDATPMLNATRARKTPHEVAMLRRANTVAGWGLEALRDLYEPGRTEAEIAAGVEAAIMTRGTGHEGARTARGWAHLMSGMASAQAYSPHPFSSSRRVERGDLGVLELGTVVDGYWSDLTRTLVAGNDPDARQREMYDAVLAGVEAVLREARPGMTGSEVDRLARSQVEQRGFGDRFVHHTGHGLGFRYHEPQPFLHPSNRDPIEEGMVSSVEPGVYFDGFGGLRLEENVVFTETGVELLSPFPRNLRA